ncbi:MAG: Histidine triad nucleotide-binding protein 2, mitochondrial [Pleopsidium flavum]|nr:MAG: Histidine triad nucleotide-binding protein 2, mitochondrial [Pleopsidium flavum]
MTEPIPAPGTCPFCTIATAHPPHPTPSTPSPNPFSPTLTVPSTYLLLSTPLVMAFLDIMPIARGHVLVATRAHRMKLSDVSVEESKALGVWVPVVCRAVMRALGMGVGEGGDWNVVQNNGAKAAQVVPHVHFHIIPRPGDVPEIKNRSWTVFGKGQREELDEDDAVMLAAKMREELVEEVRRVKEREGVDLEWERARMEKL